MSAWDDAVNREFMAKLKAIAESYDSEASLLTDLNEFGGKVYDLLYETEEIEFKGDNA